MVNPSLPPGGGPRINVFLQEDINPCFLFVRAESGSKQAPPHRIIFIVHCESEKNWVTFIFTVTLANVGRFFKFFQCRNQKEMAHNKNE